MSGNHLKIIASCLALIGGMAAFAGDATARPDGALRHLNCEVDQIARYDGSKWVCSEDVTSATECGSGEVLSGDGSCASLAVPQVIYPPKFVFISSRFTNGNIRFDNDTSLTGMEAADAICQSLAEESVLLPYGKYLAWLSDAGTSPDNSFYHSPGPYILVDGTVVADDYADLTDGTIAVPINLDENGKTVTAATSFPNVWTNTSVTGEAVDASPCQNWSSASINDRGQVGNFTKTGGSWTNESGFICLNSLHLYCVQQ